MCGVQMEINYSQRGWDEKIEDDSGNSYSRADKKQIEAAIARANRTDKKGKSAQDSRPHRSGRWPWP